MKREDDKNGFLRRVVLHNWHLKLFALVGSFLLWTTYTSAPPSEVGFQVPLEFRNIPQGLEISGDVPTHAHVRVRGRSALVRRLTPADLGISVDLHNAQAGDETIDLTAEQVAAPYGVSVVRISPAQIHVQLVSRHTSR